MKMLRGRQARSPGRRPLGVSWSVRTSASLLVFLPCLAAAQIQSTELSISTQATATSNGGGAPEGFERSDLLLSVRPRVQYSREGAGLLVRASAEAGMITSARDTQRDRILPLARLDAQGTLVDRLVFLDTSADLRQVEEDSFGSRVQGGSTQNARTVGTLRLSPRLNYDITARSSFSARYDGAWTRYQDTVDGDVKSRQGSARLETKPQPVGAALEWSSEETDYAAASGLDLRVERVNATVSLAIDGEWILGAVAGSERSEFASTRETDQHLGLRLLWAPGPRTELSAAFDRRFFGNGWEINARHRTPRMSFLMRIIREPSNAATQANARPYGGGLATFLDAILTTRVPDAAERGKVVDGLVSSRGLQGSQLGAIGSSATYPQLRTGNELAWTYLGARTTLSASIYAQELRQLDRSEESVVSPVLADADTRQRGASFGWNRRLTPQMSLDTGVAWSRIQGLAVREGDLTREVTVRASVVRNLSPHTNMSFGVLQRQVDSNVSDLNTYDETSGFVGLTHRF
jgi:uncharacterized protein (PEP-CTERM system associated)